MSVFRRFIADILKEERRENNHNVDTKWGKYTLDSLDGEIVTFDEEENQFGVMYLVDEDGNEVSFAIHRDWCGEKVDIHTLEYE